ncbi:hypothetical protein Q8F55_000067 [Vanrija albida]|uniref:F-box domain-containing protein n=1 Tax=Vanrija albida TaxID=181172 RepID=A0ABR3QD57_9TREE
MTAAVVIDHSAYPHIVNAILATCDTRTAIAFRSTCRAFRAAVDAALLSHVALYPMPAPAPSQGHNSPNTILGFVRPSDYPEPESDSEPPLLPHVPSVVRTLDFVVDNYTETHDFAGDFAGVSTLRRARDAVWSPPLKLSSLATLVDFATLYGGLYQDLILPPRPETYVLHIRWDESESAEVYADIEVDEMRDTSATTAEAGPAPPRDTVLVLEPYTSGPPAAHTTWLFFLMDIAAEMLRVLEEGGSLCIVGVDDVSPRNLGAEDGDEDEGGDGDEDPVKLFRRKLLDVWRDLEDPPEGEELDSLLSQVVFMTVAEWHASLLERGGDAYGLQAVWPAYALASD